MSSDGSGDALLELAHRVAIVGGQPTHIPMNPENVDIARASGLEVEIWPDDVGPTDCRGEPLDLGKDDEPPEQFKHCSPPFPRRFRTTQEGSPQVHWICMECGRFWGSHIGDLCPDREPPPTPTMDPGPATSADLLDLDAVPEPVDSAEPAVTYLPGTRPIGPTAETRPYRVTRTGKSR